MELFLNLVWFLISLLLIVHWTRAEQSDRSYKTWRAVIALLLLVMLLLPVISATDDLVTMTSLWESEHTEHMARRGGMALQHVDLSLAIAMEISRFAAQLFVGLALLGALLSRVVPRPSAKKLDGFGRVVGIRPPPSVALLAV